MQIVRRQFAVGQGCFHAGYITLKQNHGELHYVYDCGSASRGSFLRNAINVYKRETNHIDCLFVSHLDHDHVSGLENLLSQISVHTIYIPYVRRNVTIMDLIELETRCPVSNSLIDAFLVPEEWCGKFGVQRVVRVTPSNEPKDVNRTPNTDNFSDSSRSFQRESPSPTIVRNMRSGQEVERTSLLLEMPSGGVIMIPSHQNRCPWVLIPHVHPVRKLFEDRFIQSVRRALGLKYGEHLTDRNLCAGMRDSSKRKQIRECYEEIVARGACRMHNRVSMSLYSGPLAGPATSRTIQPHSLAVKSDAGMTVTDAQALEVKRQQAVGWLGTGDASLRLKAIREDWMSTFSRVKDQVSTILLPHHGSRYNFHSQLLEFPNLSSCVAAAANDSGRLRHPSPEVCKEVLGRGFEFHHVSEMRHSAITEIVYVAE